jgi:3-methylcrotonyl-CoA carboxylase alpha subunit
LEAGRVKIVCNGESADVRVEAETATLGQRGVAILPRRVHGRLVAIEIDGRVVSVRALRDGAAVAIWCRGRVFEARKDAGVAARPRETGSLSSPMPGRVRRVEVAIGDRVERGQVVLILEAMKMEHAIRSPREGTVAAVAFKEGDLVDAGVELVQIE